MSLRGAQCSNPYHPLYLCVLVILSVVLSPIQASISNPLRADGDIEKIVPDYNDVKRFTAYHNATPITLQHISRLSSSLESCNIDAELKWSSAVGSSVYATPVIFPSGDDGKKQIFLNTFYQYVEVLGHSGFKPWGFPLGFDGSSFQGSPVLYDIDGDGTNDIGVVDKNANLFWIRLGEFGQYLEDFHVQVPKLKVKKDWATGMDPQFLDAYVMTSMFDNRYEAKKTNQVVKPDDLQGPVKQDTYPEQNPDVNSRRRLQFYSSRDSAADTYLGRKMLQESSEEMTPLKVGVHDSPEKKDLSDRGENNLRVLDEVQREAEETHESDGSGGNGKPTVEEDGEEKVDHRDTTDIDIEDIAEHYMPPKWDDDVGPLGGGDPSEWVDDYISNHQQHYMHRRYMGDDMFYGGYMGGFFNDSNYVYVDPHVLASPTLADVNNDGNVEIIIPVSYYFDREEHPANGLDYDPRDFIAGGIACWNIVSESWSWMVHLDLTTDKTKFKALIHAAPTVADLDGDGRSEVIVGTSLGLLYVLDGDTGFCRRFFPMQFHEIQAQVAVADVRGGPDLEMILGDLGGNLVCLDVNGDVLWDVRLSGAIYHTPTIGDVDGDGFLDVVVAVAALDGYHVYAVRGDTGKVLPNYPFALPVGGEVSAPIVLVDLHIYRESRDVLSPSTYSDPHAPLWTRNSAGHEPAAAPSSASVEQEPPQEGSEEQQEHDPVPETGAEEVRRRLDGMRGVSSKGPGADSSTDSNTLGKNQDKPRRRSRRHQILSEWHKQQDSKKPKPSLHLLIPSFDGHLYIIDGKHTCAERIDLGEHIYSTPLVDDVTGNGLLDIVVGTITGHLHVLETQVPHHPLNTWSSFPKHRGNVFTHGQSGISIPLRMKKLLSYTDVKGGPTIAVSFDIWDTRKLVGFTPRYTVVFTRGTNKMEPMLTKEFSRPGRYTVNLPVVPPETLNLVVGMYNDHGQYFEDTVEISVSTRFYVWLKYLVLIPVVVAIVPLLLLRGHDNKEF